MKKRILAVLVVAFLAGAGWTGAQYTSKIVREQGGDKMVVLSGGEVEVQSGATLDVQSGSTFTLAGATTVSGTWVRAAQEFQYGSDAKVGATAGCAVAAGTNVGRMATCPASQSAVTLVVILDGLRVGDTITAFRIAGQIESAGNTVTVDADLRKLTTAAADLTDASVATITQVSVTADTILNATKTGLSSVVGNNERYYILITVTTGAATDVDFSHVSVTVTQG